MGRTKTPDEYEIRRFLTAIKGSNGNKQVICKKLLVSRSKLDSYIEKYPIIRQAVEQECEVAGDFVEGVLMEQIRKGNTACIIFYCKTKLRSRGYIERMDGTGPADPLEHAKKIRKYQRALESTVPLAPEEKPLKMVVNNDKKKD